MKDADTQTAARFKVIELFQQFPSLSEQNAKAINNFDKEF
jgi:hypothetical protein